MNTAIIVGSGPETALLFECCFSLPQNLVLFRPDFSIATDANLHLTVLDLIDPKRMLRTLSASNLTRIAMIGTFQLDNAELQGGRFYNRMIARIGKSSSVSDGIKMHLYEEYRSRLDFPPVKTVLPMLFMDDDISINPANSLLYQALEQLTPEAGCATSELNGEAIAVFGMNEGASHSCPCISIEKIRYLHREKRVKRFFFDRSHTIVVDRDDLMAYASDNELTLQSFAGRHWQVTG